MKVNKKKLLEIIEDELRKDAVREEEEMQEVDYVLDSDASVDALWKQLNFLLEDWEDKAHPYYEDLLSTVKDFSEGEYSEEETPEEEEITFEPERDPKHGGIPISGFQESIEEMVRELLAEEGEKNPWAICTAKVGREDKDKYESCVLSVKGEK